MTSLEELIAALHRAAARREFDRVKELLAELEPLVTHAEFIDIWNELPRPAPRWRGPWVPVKSA